MAPRAIKATILKESMAYKPSVQAVPSVAPTTQPTAPASTPLLATLAMTPGQPVNPRLLTRDLPQHGGKAMNRLTQDQVAAMFLPPPPIVDPVQQQPIQQTPPIQPVVQPIQQQQTPPRQQPQQPIQQTPLRQQIVQLIQHPGSVNASAGFAVPGGQPVQQFVNQVIPEHLVHRAQPDGTVIPQMVPEHLVRNIQPNLHNYQGSNLSYQYQPPSPQAQYQPGGLAQPQFACQYGQFESMQQQPQGATQQRPWADVIADVMREQFGLKPKETGSLILSAFTWFSSLPCGSISSWADLVKQFHIYFYSGVHEMKLSDLTAIKQRHDEPVHEYIQRFREMRNNCFSLSLTDAQLADLAFHGMIPPIREKFSSEDFDSLLHLIQKVRSKKVLPCQWVKSSGKVEKYDFDITKADKIFDLLLREKQIQLPVGHTIPSAEELGKKRYCKWHNSGSHSTNDCKVFRQQIQVAIEGGKIRFCWNEGMRLPFIENCPGCNDIVESSSRSYSRADEAKRLAKGKSIVAAPINMVFTLPAEFGIDQADVDEVEEGSAKLVLSPEQAIFEKPEGTENRHLKPLYINGYVNGKPMSKMKVDGGAAVNLMPYATFSKLGRNAEDLIKTNMVLKDFGGNPSETRGVLNVELTVGSKTIPTTFFIIDGKGDKIEIVPADSQSKMENPSYYFEGVVEGSNVYAKDTVDDLDDKQGQGFMSADELEEIDIGPDDRPRPTFISKNLSLEFRTKLIELLKEFRDCFAWEYYEMPGLSRSIVEHRLPIKPGVRPRQQPPRRCKADMLEPVKAEIKRFIVPVIKKNGKVRVCIDFRDLNKATPKDEYPMPVADQLVDASAGNKILSFMDGNAGYNQIFMAEEDIHKTAFRGPGAIGLFEWVVITFGLKSAGATYQRAMNYIYHDLIDWLVEVYIDDVVVKSKEVEDHIADSRKVFERTRKYGLKMNPTKYVFGVSTGQFLGFLVHERGIEVTQRSVNAIKKIQPPENKTELQEMIGKINFVRRFISNLSGRLEPFTPLLRLKADQQFTWGAEKQKALDNIKEYLSSPPVLIPSQKGIPFRLYLSAADVVRYMLSAPILKGRVGKWIFSLTEFDLRYESPKVIKGQAIADFIVEHREDSIGSVEIVPWTLFFDGSVRTHGCGIGIVIISPRGACFEFAYTIKPYATNNQAEYEAVLKGLQLLKEVKTDTIEVMGDSLQVISQLAGEYECKNDTLMVYNEKCLELMKEFRLVTLKHVSREQNLEANDLAQGESGYKLMIKDVKVEIAAMSADDWRYDVHQYLSNLSQSASRKLRYKALKYTLLDDELYYRTIDGVLLKCLSADQAKVAIGEVHERICGTHQSTHKMKWLLRRTGYFWPTMLEDCFRYYKGC
uniref:Retrotransposon protein, putative, unclassified n=1 Tax=Oryza sativa subsp. japonica TaxID=39947 RepID=Q2QPE6_ORYSJ|nr:retrotransposon protein, putative, unclassified [Oryza sativa Japonica Group]